MGSKKLPIFCLCDKDLLILYQSYLIDLSDLLTRFSHKLYTYLLLPLE